jgi:hypothetical protein
MRFHSRAVAVALVALFAWLAVGGGAVAAGLRHHRHHHPHPLPPPPTSPQPIHDIESFAPDQAQSFCRSTVEPGVKAFEKVTLATYRNSLSDGDMRACSGGSSSEHYDGRAWDWGVDHRNARQRADGRSMLRWLFKSDSDGNKDAMFRRLGLMYVIWNRRIWGSWDQHWEPYSCSGANACHVTHIHFSFGWAGAEKRTSYWTGKASAVRPPDYPVFASRHGHRDLVVSAAKGSTSPIWRLKGGDQYGVTATGVWRHSKAKRALADAVCTQSHHTWVRSPGGGVRIGGDRLKITGKRWVPTINSGNGCNAKTHKYRLALTPTAKTSVTAVLPDVKHSNDSGSVQLRFTDVS